MTKQLRQEDRDDNQQNNNEFYNNLSLFFLGLATIAAVTALGIGLEWLELTEDLSNAKKSFYVTIAASAGGGFLLISAGTRGLVTSKVKEESQKDEDISENIAIEQDIAQYQQLIKDQNEKVEEKPAQDHQPDQTAQVDQVAQCDQAVQTDQSAACESSDVQALVAQDNNGLLTKILAGGHKDKSWKDQIQTEGDVAVQTI